MTSPDLVRYFLGLAAVVLLLGLRHGFDADHLAAIDGLAFHNAGRRPRVARLSGVLFSLGHGLVVVGVAVGVSLLAQAWQAPQWLDAMGVWVSVVALTLLALVNIAAVLRTPDNEVTRVIGMRTGVLARLLRAEHPLAVAGVGIVFAISFDTISQAALFAVTGAAYGGWRPALLLGLIFTGGMIATDALNGLWVRRLVPELDSRLDGWGLALSIAVIAIVVGTYAAAMRLALRAPAPQT